MLKGQVKKETTLPKISRKRCRLKEIESSVGGTTKDVVGASQADNLSDGQCGRDVENRENGLKAKSLNLFVPVVDLKNNPLMPTSCSRAKRWIKSGKGTGFWKKGIYCVRLNVEPFSREFHEVIIGIDPGSKREGFTIKSHAHTYLNIQASAVDWVKHNIYTKHHLRSSRRARTTPCRQPRFNNKGKGYFIPPSTKARWQFKLRIFYWLKKIYPITHSVVEDLKARTIKGAKKWNKIFSPLQSGKNWFYNELRKTTSLYLKEGYETKALRDSVGLKKNYSKLSEYFETHCVDSWVLANSIVGGHILPDNKSMLIVKPLRFKRRILHVQNPIKKGIRKRVGGTMSMGLKKGSLAIHKKFGLVIIGGTSFYQFDKTSQRISLHNVKNGDRLCKNALVTDTKFLSYNSFLVYK